MKCCAKQKRKLQRKRTLQRIQTIHNQEDVFNRFRFTMQELEEFQIRFHNICDAQNKISKQKFRESMGLLGLEGDYFLADRIFDMLDDEENGKIGLSEYLYYFDVLIHGTDTEKFRMSFNMIDITRKGYFTIEEYSHMIKSMLSTWNGLTGNIYDVNENKKLDIFLNQVFRKFDLNHDGKATFENFEKACLVEPKILEIFDYFHKGIIGTVQVVNENIDENQNLLLKQLQELQGEITNIKQELTDNKLIHSKSGIKSQHDLNQLPVLVKLDGDMRSSMIFEAITPLNDKQFQHGRDMMKKDKTDEVSIEDAMQISSPYFKQNSMERPREHYMSERDYFEGHKIIPIVYNFFDLPLGPDKVKPKVVETEGDLSPLSTDRSKGLSKASTYKSSNNLFQIPEVHHEDSPDFKQKPKPKIKITIPVKPDLDSKPSLNIETKFKFDHINKRLDHLMKIAATLIDEIQKSKSKSAEEFKEVLEEGHKEAFNSSPSKSNNQKDFVYLGHENWNLILNMMLGIQMAVRSPNQRPSLDPNDFRLRYVYELVPKRANTPSKVEDKICRFYDYAPSVFYHIRKILGIRNEDYLKSLGPENMLNNLMRGNLSTLTELTSTGKSGSFFYFSGDGKYTLKTVPKVEFKFLRKTLESYYRHLMKNPNSLIVKFFGCHKMQFINSKSKTKCYFVIMGNVLPTNKEIHIRYDLKGSTKGRLTKEDDPNVAKKDLNLINSGEKLLINQEQKKEFLEILKADARFFMDNKIIDYSLLIGVHNLDENDLDYDQAVSFRSNFKIFAEKGILSNDKKCVYFFGIIDTLTEFNIKKKFEYICKRPVLGKGISCIPPKSYGERFFKFLESIISS